MNKWNIIAPQHYIDQIRKSKYYSQDLGESITVHDVKKGGERKLRENSFASWYYSKYKSLLFKSGKIGILHFYIDYYLKKEVMGFFLNSDMDTHQYAVEWDQEKIDEIGITAWMGEKLKEVDESLNPKRDTKKEINKGDSNKVASNPGNVSWKDIEEYMNKKNKR